jgi:hypothetical protein
VSPLWRDEVAILIGPRQLVLTRMSRGLRPRCIADRRRTVDGSLSLDWRPALAALGTCLSEAEWQDANLRVVVANHWARYAIVPWANDITNDEERLAHARICLAGIYGNVAEQWRVGLSHAAPGAARIACAVEGDLIDEMGALVAARGLRLSSIQPQLVASFNGWRRKLEDRRGWFVNIDEGSLAAARLIGGGWDRVYSARIGSDWAIELQRLRTFGRLAAKHSENGRVFVAAPAWLRKLADTDDVGIEWLEDEDRGAGDDEDLSVLKRLYA